MYAQLLRRRRKSGLAVPEITVEQFPNVNRIDDPRLVDFIARRTEKTNLVAQRLGLPAVGSLLTNPHGLEFIVEAHAPAPTVHSIQRWRDGGGEQPEDLFPSLSPQNLSKRLQGFVDAVDRCTTKTLTLLDTMPHVYADRGVPGGHYIDTVSNSGVNFVFIDAANIHETHFAHEIGHAWVQYVDGAEDMRVMEDVSNPQRLHQLHFIQSFVLDLRVNEVIRAKGFDMSVIENDSAAAIRSYGRIAAAGGRPESRREAVLTALLLAPHMLAKDGDLTGSLAKLDGDLELIRRADSECYELAVGFADAVRRHGYETADGIKAAIDECLIQGFEFTEDGIDLEKDLVVRDETEPEFDKRPGWLVGASPRFKCDVGRLMALNDIPTDSTSRYAGGPSGPCNVIFRLPDGTENGPHQINLPNPWLYQTDHFRLINEINRQNRERQMNNHLQPPSGYQPPKFPEPPKAPQPPNPNGPGFPDFNGGRRSYMAGFGRFLSAVREAELLGGEPTYAYAMGNPVTYTDPSGLEPCGPVDPCKKFPHLPGFWDDPAFSGIVDSVVGEKGCSGLDPSYLKALLKCIVYLESSDTPGGYSFPTTGAGVQGPCQIWPGRDKDKLCGTGWRNSLRDHMRCCALILCECIKGAGRNVVKGCGTVGTGLGRSGQFEVINESGSGYTPKFKCCMIQQGIKSPSQIVPKQTPWTPWWEMTD